MSAIWIYQHALHSANDNQIQEKVSCVYFCERGCNSRRVAHPQLKFYRLSQNQKFGKQVSFSDLTTNYKSSTLD